MGYRVRYIRGRETTRDRHASMRTGLGRDRAAATTRRELLARPIVAPVCPLCHAALCPSPCYLQGALYRVYPQGPRGHSPPVRTCSGAHSTAPRVVVLCTQSVYALLS